MKTASRKLSLLIAVVMFCTVFVISPGIENSSVAAEGKKITVKFNANKGKVSKKSKKVSYEGTYGKLPSPKRDGYGFLGWYSKKKSGNKITKSSIVQTKNKHTLYARWGKKTTVKFVTLSGKVSKKSKKIVKGKKYGSLPTPTRKGYEFDGWYTKKSGGKLITSESKVTKTKNSTLYAYWKKEKTQVTVTFDSNGGYSVPNKVVVPGKTYGTLEKTTKPPTSKTNGLVLYTFEGWWTAPTGGELITSDTIVKLKQDHTLYAHWSSTFARL